MKKITLTAVLLFGLLIAQTAQAASNPDPVIQSVSSPVYMDGDVSIFGNYFGHGTVIVEVNGSQVETGTVDNRNIKFSMKSLKPAITKAGSYYIRVRNKDGHTKFLDLVVKERPVIMVVASVTSPKAGDVFSIGDTVNINWTTNVNPVPKDVNAGVRLELVDSRTQKVSAATFLTLTNLPNSGSYSWKIPERVGNLVLGGDSVYQIVVHSGHYASSPKDEAVATSTGYFSIINDANSIKVKNPAIQVPQNSFTGNGTNDGGIQGRNDAVKFDVVAGKATASLNSVTVDLDTSSSTASVPTIPPMAYLVADDSHTPVASAAPRVGHVYTFNNINTTIATSTQKGFTVKFDLPTNTTSGTIITGRVIEIVPGKGLSISKDSAKLPISGGQLSFYSYSTKPYDGVAQYILSANPTIQVTGTNQNGSSTSVTATFPFKVKAQGGLVEKPNSGNFMASFVNANTGVAQPAFANVVVIPDTDIVKDKVASVTVTMTDPAGLLGSGLYYAKLIRLDKNGAETYTTSTSTPISVVAVNSSLTQSTQTASVFEGIKNFFKSLFGI